MKKCRYFLFILLLVFVPQIFACESTNEIRSAYFTNSTVYGSSNHTINVVLQSDKRVNEKNFDIQVKANREKVINIHKENEEDVRIAFEDTRWNSLTTLFVEGKNQPNTEEFSKYKDVSSLTYIITSDEDISLTFRLVVGDAESNATETGYILANSMPVSEEFSFNITAKEAN